MIVISENVYLDVLDEVVKKYNNKVHRTIKMKPIEFTSNSYAMKIQMNKKLSLKFVIALKFKNIKTFC